MIMLRPSVCTLYKFDYIKEPRRPERFRLVCCSVRWRIQLCKDENLRLIFDSTILELLKDFVR